MTPTSTPCGGSIVPTQRETRADGMGYSIQRRDGYTDSMPIDALRAIVGPANCLVSEAELLVYECDGLTLHTHRPSAVVLPSSRDEVVAIVKACRAAGVPTMKKGR